MKSLSTVAQLYVKRRKGTFMNAGSSLPSIPVKSRLDPLYEPSHREVFHRPSAHSFTNMRYASVPRSKKRSLPVYHHSQSRLDLLQPSNKTVDLTLSVSPVKLPSLQAQA